jgi:Flp pilus assembly protein TadG
MILIRIIILFFILLLGFQIYSMMQSTKEGLENESDSMSTTVANPEPVATTNSSLTYQPYNSNDPNSALILSQQNAGNIEYLKGRVNDLEKSNTKINEISQNMGSMQTQIDVLVKQQADYVNAISTPAPVEAEEEV